MITFKVKGNFETKEKFHKALVGSPGYVNSEIAICDEDEESFLLIVGNKNDDDIAFEVCPLFNN